MIEPRCKICKCPYRKELEELYLSGMTIKDVKRYAEKKYNLNYSYKSYWNHMTKHIKELINREVESNKLREKIVKEEVYKQIEISKNLRKNIESLQSIINKRLENISKDSDLSILLALLREARQLYELLLRYDEKIDLKPEVDKDELYNKIIECFLKIKIPNEYIVRFQEEWNKYDSKSS